MSLLNSYDIIEWKKVDTNKRICIMKKKASCEHDVSKSLSQNGTLTLKTVTKDDAGLYSLELFKDGMSLIEEETKLNIEVWVPKLTITENCDNGIVLTCNVENSYVEKFDWTLNGKSLSPTQAQFSGNNEKVTLKMTFKTSDTFVCIARSATKSVESAPKTLTCKADINWFLIGGIAVEGLLVLVLFVVICCICQKNRQGQQSLDEELPTMSTIQTEGETRL
ncbi:uncharacterized protein LOC117972858 [Acipenser ruthenus]|uniref:uncharacterized protein LOC117972858 n=1 Tax=Acipenser ruthenus TaxID=7906 RepID=UPI002741FE95|nr:uncharacterized protein LOC117972858 [Acipenser ruthenus]